MKTAGSESKTVATADARKALHRTAKIEFSAET
jgi:hypothetical protein